MRISDSDGRDSPDPRAVDGSAAGGTGGVAETGGGGGVVREGKVMMRRWRAALTLGLLAGCGGGGAGTVLHAPLIQNLVITPLTPLVQGQRGSYQFQVDFFDPDGDLAGGSCEINTTIGPASLPLAFSVGNPTATAGTVVCVFETIVLGRVVAGQFTITDANGLTSNAINFTLPAERVTTRR
jgi:hypothetical protein